MRHRLLNLLKALSLLLCVAAAGCGWMLSPLMGETPHATGTWTGQLVSVLMRDLNGREHPAAAVDIESGPRALRGSGVEWTVKPERDLVLLWRGRAIIDPRELSVPVGSRVKVSGRLSAGSSLKSCAKKGSSDRINKTVVMVSEGERNTNLGINIGGRSNPMRK